MSNSFIIVPDFPVIITISWRFKGYLVATTSAFVTIKCEYNRQESVGSGVSHERLLLCVTVCVKTVREDLSSERSHL